MTEEPKLPRIDAWYDLATRIVELICKRAGCTEATLDRCKFCPVRIMSDHITFYYEMGWFTLVQSYCYYMKNCLKNLIETAKSFITIRYVSRYDIPQDQYYVWDKHTRTEVFASRSQYEQKTQAMCHHMNTYIRPST